MGISNSPFESHLGTNFIPSPSEIQDIKNLLYDPNAELLLLDAEISRLQKKRDQLYQHIAAHQALISPARRLPRDVIQEIFVHCLPSIHNAFLEMKSSQAPLLLGRICSAWRAISLTTPSLWDSVCIVAPVMPPSNDNDPVPYQAMFYERKRMMDLLVLAVEEWLKRSGSRPLSISLTPPHMFLGQSLDINAYFSSPLFDVILHFYHRWQNIKIQVPCLNLAETISQLANLGITDSMPQLASLELRGPLGPPNGTKWLLPFVAPKLNKMTLHWMENFTTIHFPWHQLTELALNLMPIMVGFEQQVINLLSACTRLEKLYMNIRGMESTVVPRYVSLPFLKSFMLLEDMDNAEFVSALHLPALRHLAFCAFHTNRRSLLDLLRRFGGPLETLYLGVNTPVRSGPQVLEYLPFTPQLLRFGIEKPSFFEANESVHKDRDDHRIHRPAFLNDLSDELCPLLEKLYLMDGARLSDQQLLDFILSRQRSSRHGVSKIKQITAVFHRDREIDIVKKLSELREGEGLSLRLLYGQEAEDRKVLGYTLPSLSNLFAN